ncbi:ngg1p [Saccharomyces arboricola H-6]|uniref:Ngg1p n=1 Tax=Saccharomyces arboricola (strain H-6 / AS 2.3317 / CBS 10644) TaxID=1160507 RepID=J8PJN9_SACAR|nr:ngg1p [Saccharomyces arboricola H-6]
MPRHGRRGKLPKGEKFPKKEETDKTPSKLLSSMLKTLDLTFERDIGMLNGKNVRSIPSKKTLLELQTQLDSLNEILGTIAQSDQETIEALRKIRDSKNEKDAENKKQKDVDHKKQEQLPKEDNVQEEVADKEKEEGEKSEGGPSKSHVSDTIPDTIDNDIESIKQAADNIAKEEIEEDKILQVNGDEPSEKRPLDPETTNELTESERTNEPENKKQKVDVDKMENDPSVKNPKSEFVVSQTLPRAAAALGLFNEEGLESTGEDFLKRKYNVASYPTNDLKELLPGELPDLDFSHPKPTNQIQFNTFLAFVENFFKDLSDDNLKFLKTKYIIPDSLQFDRTYDPEIKPFIIPKLGPLYTDVWFKDENDKNSAFKKIPPHINDASGILPKKSANELDDNALETESVSCGPLLSRLLSAILTDDDHKLELQSSKITRENDVPKIKEEGNVLPPKNSKNDETDIPLSQENGLNVRTPDSDVEDDATIQAKLAGNKSSDGSTTSTLPQQIGWITNGINLDYPTFEERLKRELKYVGIYMNMPKDENNPNLNDPDWITGREDDEISAELRELQGILKQVTKKNQKRKALLIPLVERQLAWQEYTSILEDLDKQIDQAYVKRIRVPKKRKKHHTTASSNVNTGTTSQIAQQKAANSSLKSLLDKRQRWVNKIGPLFDKPETMKRIPNESVFKDMDQEEDEDEGDVFGQNTNKDVELN